MHLAAAKEDAVSIHDTFSIERNENAVDVAALTRALDAGQVDVAVHWLQLLLMESGDQDHPLTKRRKTIKHTRVRRLKTLQNAVAQMLRDYDKDREEDSLTLRPGLATAVCELSYSQLQMFALQRMRPSSTAYNVVRALQFTDVPLDLAALESACNALVAKHEALRTCFDVDASAGAQPRQIVHPLSHFQGELGVFRVVQSELLTLLDSSSDAELAAVVAKVADEPFDLARQAPIRVYAVVSPEQSSTPWVLAVVLHHIATDAASSQLFWNDFHTLYDRFLHSENAMVSTAEVIRQLEVEASSGSRVTYRDFAVWQRSRMRSGVLAPALQYWMQQLTESGAPPLLELPFDSGSTIASVELNAPESSTTKGDVVVFRSAPTLQKAFSALCHAQGASMFMGLLAVFYLLIGRLSGQQDFVIGAPSSGRGLADLQDVMGYFVNTLPLRLGVKCSEDADFTEFLFSVREVVLGAYNHMEIPFHKVLEHLRATAQSDRDVGGDAERRWQHPLFQIMFSWEHSDDSSDSKKYVELSLPHQSAKFDLMLSMRYRRLKGAAVGDRVLEGSMEFPTARFTRDTVERFTGYYLTF